jgi:hypothetical protein
MLLALVAIGGAAYALTVQPWKGNDALRNTASTHSAAASHTAAGTAAGGGQASHSAAASPAASASGEARTTASPSAGAVTEQQAAANVATMLSQSVSDRSAINAAWNDVLACGPNLAADERAFTGAANSRKALLSSLATMPGRASLPPALLTDLTSAWQASMAADQDYARWTNDEITQGCVPNDTSDPGYAAAGAPNTSASDGKAAFTAEWNPIAVRYGLTQYQADQL